MRPIFTEFQRAAATCLLVSFLLIPPATNCPQTAATNTVDEFIHQLSADAPNARCEAIVALERLGADAVSAAPLLVPLLSNNFPAAAAGRAACVSDFAERALLAIGEPAVPALIAGLQNDDALVRRRCGDLLGVIKSNDAIAVLVARLSDKDRDVAVGASVALSRLGQPAVDSLVNLLQDSLPKIPSDRDTLVTNLIRGNRVEIVSGPNASSLLQACGCAIDALGQIDDDRTVEPLLQALGGDSLHLRRAAAQALHRRSIIPGSSPEFLSREDVVSRLVAALITGDETMRRMVLALLKRCPRSAMEPVLAALQSTDSGKRQAAFDARSSIFDDPRVAAAAMERLTFEDDLLTENGNFEGVSSAIQYLSAHHNADGEW